MIMRNMLPAAGFAHSVQAAERGTEEATLGRYYPKVEYFADEAAFATALLLLRGTASSSARRLSGGGEGLEPVVPNGSCSRFRPATRVST